MQRSFAFFLSFSFLVLIGGCSPSGKKEVTEWKVVNSRNFSILLPSFLKKGTDLHEDAVVQYQNVLKEFYFIVIQDDADAFYASVEDTEPEEKYTSDIDGYARFVTNYFTANVDSMYTKTDLKPVTVAGMEGRYFEANAKVGEVDIHYHYGFVQGDTTYYQLLSWTLMNKEAKYNDAMLNILQSFKEK